MLRKEKLILLTTVISHALTHVAELTFPSTALLVTGELLEKGKGYAEIGIATFISALLFGLAALPSGRLVDKLGARRVILIFLFGTGASLVVLSFSTGFVMFTIALAAVGLFSGLYHPAGTTMISLGIREHGKAMGAHGVGGNLGLAVTPFFAASLARALGDWRLAYMLIGALPVLLGLFILFRLTEVGAKEEGPPEEKSGDSGTNPGGLQGSSVLVVPLVLLFVMAVFNGMTYRGLMTFLPSYFAERVEMNWEVLSFLAGETAAGRGVIVGGVMTTFILLLGVVGQYAGGNLADRVKKEKLYCGIFFVTAPILLSLAFLSGAALVAATGLFAFLYFANQPVGNSTLPRYTSPAVRGVVFGLFFFVNFGAGSIMSWIAGETGERFNLSYIFYIFAACLTVAGLLGIWLAVRTRSLD
ncbi:MAG: MFS transporter [bacterium]